MGTMHVPRLTPTQGPALDSRCQNLLAMCVYLYSMRFLGFRQRQPVPSHEVNLKLAENNDNNLIHFHSAGHFLHLKCTHMFRACEKLTAVKRWWQVTTG